MNFTNNFKNDEIKNNINLMIVAHPDDETLWGSNQLIIQPYSYLVVCLSNGFDIKRKNKFFKALKIFNQYGIIYNYANCIKTWKKPKYEEKIYNTINEIILKYNVNNIVTHNYIGEYKHPHHIQINKLVTTLVKKHNIQERLYFFAFSKMGLEKLDKRIIRAFNIYFSDLSEKDKKSDLKHIKASHHQIVVKYNYEDKDKISFEHPYR